MISLNELSKISTYRPTTGPLHDLFRLVERGASREDGVDYLKKKEEVKTISTQSIAG